MKYTEVNISISPLDPYRDVLIYSLGDEGPYDSFEETPQGVKAYIPTKDYDETFLKQVLADNVPEAIVTYQVQKMPEKDWNADWERNYQPVLVEGYSKSCCVRAPFHPSMPEATFDIVVNPKMAFGTAHHATTTLMISQIMDMDEALQGMHVLDMGCGTAVLALLCAKMGAAKVDAVDIDEWAYRNAQENTEVNHCDNVIDCRLGDAATLPAVPTYDLVLANINRNILLRDMPAYVAAMKEDSTLLLSGFYETDIPDLRQAAQTLGLETVGTTILDDWAQMYLMK